MRIIFIFAMLCSTDFLHANDSLWLSLWRKAPVVVEAKVVSRGRIVCSDGCICEIACVVQQAYKGYTKPGDTLNIEVIETRNIPLGGKLMDFDTPHYEEGKTFVFFLDSDYVIRFHEGTLYNPVDDEYGALEPSMYLRTWLVNDVGEPR